MTDRERDRQRTIAEHRRDAAPVVAALRRAGFDVDSLDELRESRLRYVEAVPILLHWLPRIDSLDVKESIVRCLSVPWARGAAAGPLIAEYHRAPKEAGSFRWAVGNALAVVADPSVADDVIGIVSDASNGTSRQMFVAGVPKLRRPDVVPLLVRLLDDADVTGHALAALGKLRAVDARPHVERMLQHPKAWIRKEARLALRRIERAEP